MAGLDAARLRALADELDREEAEAKRELEQADSQRERDELRRELDELKAKSARLEEQIRRAAAAPTNDDDDSSDDDDDSSDDDDELENRRQRRRFREGRKRGAVYTNPETGMGEVWNGDDEPDRVEVDADGNDVEAA